MSIFEKAKKLGKERLDVEKQRRALLKEIRIKARKAEKEVIKKEKIKSKKEKLLHDIKRAEEEGRRTARKQFISKKDITKLKETGKKISKFIFEEEKKKRKPRKKLSKTRSIKQKTTKSKIKKLKEKLVSFDGNDFIVKSDGTIRKKR